MLEDAISTREWIMRLVGYLAAASFFTTILFYVGGWRDFWPEAWEYEYNLLLTAGLISASWAVEKWLS